jgi:purine-binding chemotaxis protein CheW
MEAVTQTVERAQYLTFRVADEEYAIEILRVREIVPFGTITSVPKTPPWIRGVTLLRGQAVPVVDLAAKLGLPATVAGPATCIVTVEARLGAERVVMGVTADGVSRVVDLGPGDIQAPPVFGTRVRVEFLLGLAKIEESLVLMLDIDKVLSADEIIALADVATEAEESPAEVQTARGPATAAPGGPAPRAKRAPRSRPLRD